MKLLRLNFLHFYLCNTNSIENVIKEEKEYLDALLSFWKENNYLTPKWWFLVFLSVIPPIIWWKFVNKKRLTEITLFGLFYGMAAVILDSIGCNLMFWIYPVRLTPYFYPEFYPYDVGVVIIPFMLLFQLYGNKLVKYFIYTGCFSAFLAYIAEPLMEFLNIYREISWKNTYSFLLYWILSILCWSITKKFKKMELKQ